jgi:hypothetical protein
MKKTAKKKPESAADPSSWYEIDEWIPADKARANVACWAPVAVKDGAGLKVWREEDRELAEKEFAAIKPGRKMRLVLVTRKVMEEKS